jgi:hypothetical protein
MRDNPEVTKENAGAIGKMSAVRNMEDLERQADQKTPERTV